MGPGVKIALVLAALGALIVMGRLAREWIAERELRKARLARRKVTIPEPRVTGVDMGKGDEHATFVTARSRHDGKAEILCMHESMTEALACPNCSEWLKHGDDEPQS